MWGREYRTPFLDIILLYPHSLFTNPQQALYDLRIPQHNIPSFSTSCTYVLRLLLPRAEMENR